MENKYICWNMEQVCHSEHSEESEGCGNQILHFVQDDIFMVLRQPLAITPEKESPNFLYAWLCSNSRILVN